MDPRPSPSWLMAGVLTLLGACTSSDSGLSPAVRLGADRTSPTASAELPLVSLPGQIVLAPDGRELFACQPILGRVLRTRLADSSTSVVTTSAYSPWGLAYVPALDRYLACDTSSRVLLLLDPAAGQERTVTSPFAGSPVGAAPLGNGTMALVLFAEGFLAELPLQGGEGRRIDPFLRDPWGLAVEPGADRALVCERGRGRLVRVELATGTVQTIATGLADPTDVLLEPGGGGALVACAGGAVRRVDLATGETTLLAALPGATTLGPGRTVSEFLAADYYNGKVYAVDRITADSVVLVEGLGEPTWLAVAGAGRLAVVDQTALGGLYRVDLAGQAARLVLLLEDGRDLQSIAVEPGDQNVLVATGPGELLRVPLEPGPALRLAHSLSNPSGLACSADGRKLFFAERVTGQAGASTRLAELDLQSLRLTDLTPALSLPQRVHAMAAAPWGRLAVRDAAGLFLFDPAFGSATGYLAGAQSVSGLAASWPRAWLAHVGTESNPAFELLEVDMLVPALRVLYSGSGIQPVGLDLSRDGGTLFAADLAGAAVIGFRLE